MPRTIAVIAKRGRQVWDHLSHPQENGLNAKGNLSVRKVSPGLHVCTSRLNRSLNFICILNSKCNVIYYRFAKQILPFTSSKYSFISWMFKLKQHNLPHCPTAKSCCRDAIGYTDPPTGPGGTEGTAAAATTSKFKALLSLTLAFPLRWKPKGGERIFSRFLKILPRHFAEGGPIKLMTIFGNLVLAETPWKHTQKTEHAASSPLKSTLVTGNRKREELGKIEK